MSETASPVTREAVEALQMIARTYNSHPAAMIARRSLERCALLAFQKRPRKMTARDREKPPTHPGVSA